MYALVTALCVAWGKVPKRSSSLDGRDHDKEADGDSMVTDEPTDSLDNGPSIGRLVIDGCCHAFAEALGKVGPVFNATATVLLLEGSVNIAMMF